MLVCGYVLYSVDWPASHAGQAGRGSDLGVQVAAYVHISQSRISVLYTLCITNSTLAGKGMSVDIVVVAGGLMLQAMWCHVTFLGMAWADQSPCVGSWACMYPAH